MPDVHVPHLEKSFLKVAMEVALIATGVFLGLMGEQWREHVQHREAAQSALRLFRAEDLGPFVSAATVYYGDVVLIEPKLLEAYDEVIPKINLALGDSH